MTYRSQDLHLCAGSESASVFWHIISSQQVGKPDHFYLLAAYLQDKKICRNLKIFPDNLDNNTESVRMLNFIFKGWSKVWCLCSSSGQNGCCEARRECIHTHIHGYAVSRLPELWIKSSSSLKRMHIQAELLLWIGSGHTWGPVHVVGCISVQPWGHSLWNSPGIHTAHRQSSVRSYSSFQVVLSAKCISILPHHFIRMRLILFQGCAAISGCIILTHPGGRAAVSAVVPQPWSTQDSCGSWVSHSCSACPGHHFWPEQSLPEPDSGNSFLLSLVLDKQA